MKVSYLTHFCLISIFSQALSNGKDTKNRATSNNTRFKVIGKIANGTKARISEYPFLVYFRNTDSWCGGSLITRRVVMTAAHCVLHNKDARHMQVVVGRTRVLLEEIDDYPEHDVHSVCSFIVHKDYEATELHPNDIALLLLHRPVHICSKVRKGYLPKNQNFLKDFTLNTFHAAGWGTTIDFHGDLTERLLKTRLSLVPNNTCGKVFQREVHEDILCLVGELGDVCTGDSGGGILYKGYVVGIVSYTRDGCHNGVPTVYTNVYHFIPWIKKSLKEMENMTCGS